MITRGAEQRAQRTSTVVTALARRADKGEPITIGLIVITLIKSSAAVAIIRAIEKACTRERRLKAELKVGKRSIKVQAENLSSEERERIQSLIQSFADEASKKK
jgi:hypothetical protein